VARTTVCSECGNDLQPGFRFCGSCGAPLAQTCAACRQQNPPGFRFCGHCGAALNGTAPAAPAIAETREERRLVTVLFADLSGYTSLSERLDPEDLRVIVDTFMDEMGRTVRSHDGFVSSVMGDGLLAVFGAPTGHEDDPERAVRAALEMQLTATKRVAELGGLPLRIGIDTGGVFFAPVGPEGQRTPNVLGDTVNTASRLQSAAPKGGILVGEETYRATARTIAYDEVPAIAARGKQDPVRAWQVRSAVREPAFRPVSRAPMVGRDSQLRLLLTIWQEVTDRAQPHLVTVLGEPGIGKTKLAREFAAQVSVTDGAVCSGRSLPYGERSGYEAFAEMLTSWAHIVPGDDVATARDKLANRLHELGGASADDGLVQSLGVLLKISDDKTVVDKRTLFAAARAFVEALAARAPTLLVFEDMHLADEGQLELVQWLVARLQATPVLFLITARPELLDQHRSWGAGSIASHTIPLGPLTDAETAMLAARLLPDDVKAATMEQLQRSAGGNPLFAEELAEWLSRPDAHERALPTTITTMIAARVDTLPPDPRQVLLAASVVGQNCSRGLLGALVEQPATLADALEELERRDFLLQTRRVEEEGEHELAFKHALIRDVAYEMLPRSTRRARHRTVAEQLECRSADSALAVLALHWREAGEAERAFGYYVAAAEQAARGWAKHEAVLLYTSALELIADDDPRRKQIAMRRNVARQMWLHATIDADQLRARPANAPDQ
jgi:class 3 adenylate cyclase